MCTLTDTGPAVTGTYESHIITTLPSPTVNVEILQMEAGVAKYIVVMRMQLLT